MGWKELNDTEASKPYFKELTKKVEEEYKAHECYPPFNKILAAMALTPLENVKCVIVGQDPYHGTGQAMGLSFSVQKGVSVPPSLQNIYKELNTELGCPVPSHGDLTAWANQGVLLLNAILSVRAHQAASHRSLGWEQYTDAILSEVAKKPEPVVYMLWGNFARSKKELIKNPRHLVLECPHPSPYSASYGFFGCGHFKKCNQFLERNGVAPIDWRLPT